MNIKSNIFEFIAIGTFLGLLLFSYKITNPRLIIILVPVCVVYLCYEIYRTIIKKEYKTTWVIVINNIVVIVLIFVMLYFYLHPINVSDHSQLLKRMTLTLNIKLALIVATILDRIFKIEKFKKQLSL